MKKKIKYFLGLSLTVLAVLTTTIITQETPTQTLSYQISAEDIVMEPRSLVSQTFSTSPNKTHDIFISQELQSDFEFTSVGGEWEQYIPKGTSIYMYVRFKSNEEWSEWIDLEVEEDRLSDKYFAFASSNPSEAFQYKALMHGDGINTPRIENPKWTFIRAGNYKSTPAPVPSYASSTLGNDMGLLALSNNSSVVSRSQWGANESYRYLSDNDSDAQLAEIPEDDLQEFADELTFSQVIQEDSNGDKYKWPLEYPERVKKVIVHHTATTKNLTNPKQAIRDIYYFHSVSRGWGDIGYNYIIDRNGEIYEGRYGGEGVIGAHSGISNNSSIGIAVLGDYEDEEVPANVIQNLSDFVGEKMEIHGLDPLGYSTFRGENMPNIFAHRDVSATRCPGIHIYEKLPVIRTLADNNYKSLAGTSGQYGYLNVSNLQYFTLVPGETTTVRIQLENVGTKTWNSTTKLKLKNSTSLVSFPNASSNSIAEMNKDQVDSGQVATFTFQIKAGQTNTFLPLEVVPEFNSDAVGNDSIVVPIVIKAPEYEYQFVDADYPNTALKPGETFRGTVRLKNTGNTSWNRLGENKITLRSDLSTIIGILDSKTEPGEIGEFSITSTAGEINNEVDFIPYVDDVGWLADTGLNFEIRVDKASGSLNLANYNFYNFSPGKRYNIDLELENTDSTSWDTEDIKLFMRKERGLRILNANIEGNTVGRGESVNLSLTVEVNPESNTRSSLFTVYPVVRGKHVKNSSKVVYYTTGFNGIIASDSNQVQTSEIDVEQTVRVKISFEGTPQITANGAYNIYSGDKQILKLFAYDTATVEKYGDQYRIKTSKGTIAAQGPIRFEEVNDAIFEIKNFENRPTWDTTGKLNDNQYRGIIEVRLVDGELAVINELNIEDYLKGLGEVSNTEELEKIKAIMVAARSYAAYYTTVGTKFPGKPYDLNDDPNATQKYLGYGLEKRSPNVSKGVQDTAGQVITYDGEIVIAPYFNQSDGKRTKTAKEVWGWTHTPYLVSVADTYCDGTGEFLGHGVGLSGCGAKGMAIKGFTYQQILKHYYTGIDITDLY